MYNHGWCTTCTRTFTWNTDISSDYYFYYYENWWGNYNNGYINQVYVNNNPGVTLQQLDSWGWRIGVSTVFTGTATVVIQIYDYWYGPWLYMYIQVQVQPTCTYNAINQQSQWSASTVQLQCTTNTYTIFYQPYHTDYCSAWYNNPTYCGPKTFTTSHAWLDIGTATPGGNVQYIVNTNSPAIVGTYTVTVTIRLTNYPQFTTTQSWSVTIRSPCYVTTISTLSQSIGSINFPFGSSTLFTPFVDFTDSESICYGNKGGSALSCPITYTLTANSYGVSIVAGPKISVYTTNSGLKGTGVSLTISANTTPQQNTAAATLAFNVYIKDTCQATSLSGANPVISYTVGGTAQWLATAIPSYFTDTTTNTCCAYRYLATDLTWITTSHSKYTRNGVSLVNSVNASTGQPQFYLASTTMEFGMTVNAYEDIIFLVEFWDTCFTMPARYYKQVTVRVYNQCNGYGYSTPVLNVASPQTVYAGATLTLNTIGYYGSVSVGAQCQQNARLRLKNSQNVYFEMGDAFTDSLISSWSYISGSPAYHNLVILPKLASWKDGLSTDVTSLTIEFNYWHSKSGDSTVRVNSNYYTQTLQLNILPLAKLIAVCKAENKMTVSGSVGNQSYTLGGSAITISPPSFTLTAPTGTTYSNTNFPISYLMKYTKLEYQPSGGSWSQMPTSPTAATFVSTNSDTSCFPNIDSYTLGFSIQCSDATKFATTSGTDVVVTFRYTGQWVKVYDQPTAEQTAIANTFTLTLINPCKFDSLSMDTAASSKTIYSGARLDVAAVSVTHSVPAACSTYHTLLVEVGIGATYYSSGKNYDDVLTSRNDDTQLVIEPNPLVFDSAVNTRYVRITARHSIFGTTLSKTYTLTIQPESARCELANSQRSSVPTLQLVQTHQNIVYTVGDPPFPVSTSNVQVKPPVDTSYSNTNLRICATATQLYYGLSSGAETTLVSSAAGSTWTSSSGTESCIYSMDSTLFGFTLSCSNNANYNFTGGSKIFYMKYWTYFTTSTSQTKVVDTFTITIKNRCFDDVLQITGALTGSQTAYAGAVLKLPSMPWSHVDGVTNAICPVTIASYVWDGSVWQPSGNAAYTNLITLFTSGALTITPAVGTYGSGTAIRNVDVKTTYTQTITGQVLTDQFTISVRPTVDISNLANSQLNTLAVNTHPDVSYTVGAANVVVATSDVIQTNPVDPLGKNDLSSGTLTPPISRKLQYLSGSTWVDLANDTSGIVSNGASCILSGSLASVTWGFTLSCTDNTKFGISSAGQDIFNLRYVIWYTSVTSGIRYVYDPFVVTIKNACSDQTLTVTDAQRTQPQSTVAGTLLTVSGISYTNSASAYATCVIDTLVEVYDDVTKMIWTSSTSNAFYTSFFDGTQTTAGPIVKVNAATAASHWSAIKTAQVRVTYTARYSQVTNGKNLIVDQYPVTIMPFGYVLACRDATFGTTPIANFALTVKNTVGTALSNKTFGVSRSDSISACTGTSYTFTLEFNDPSAGYTTNPYSAYYSLTSAGGVLTYTPPPASFMNGQSIMTVNYKLTASFNAWPVKLTVQYLTITLNNICMTTKFTSMSTQSAITYEDGSSSTYAFTAFSYSLGGLTSVDCGLVHAFAFKSYSTDVWSSTQPAYVLAGTPDTTTLAFSIKTTTASIATPGDSIASRWVQRSHYNPHSKETITQEFQIFFVKSIFCQAKTASLITTSTLNLAYYYVGSGARTMPIQLNTNSGMYWNSANDASHCSYTATCQIWQSSTQSWVAPASWAMGGISCDATGMFTVNVLTTNTNYNPNFTITMRVIYDITDSQVALALTPSRQVVSQFNLDIWNACKNSIVTHTSFPDITYYVGAGSLGRTFQPAFSGAVNASCVQVVTLSLKLDGSGDTAWVNWASGSFTIGGTTYTFINPLTTTGLISALGGFTITSANQAQIRPSTKFNARITLYNSWNGLTDTLLFNIDMVDVCSVNQLTQSSIQANIYHTVLPASTATADVVVNWTTLTQNSIPSYQGTTAGGSCLITRELWAQTDNGWLKATDSSVAGSPASYASKTPVLDFVTLFRNTDSTNTVIASSQSFKVSASYNSAWLSGLFVNNQGRTYTLKLVAYDQYSTTTKSRVEETFTVTFALTCNADTVCIFQNDGTTCLSETNTISKADASPNILYVAGGASVTIPKSGKQMTTGCPFTVLYQYFKEDIQSWTDFGSIQNLAIKAHASGDGQVTVGVLTSDVNNFCPERSYKIRVTYTSTQSLSTSKSAYDEYTIKIKGAATNEITLRSSVRENFIYNIPNASSPMIINPIDPAGTNTITVQGCALTCTLQILNLSTNVWSDFTPTTGITFQTTYPNVCRMTIDFTTASTYWTGAGAPNLNRQRTTYTFRIGVQFSNVLAITPGVYAAYDDFTLVMQHYCYNDYFTLTAQKADFIRVIHPVDQGGGNLFGTTNVGATAVTQSDTTCAKILSLEIYDPVSKTWIDYNTDASKATKWPYVQNYSTVTAIFDIKFSTDLGPTYDATSVTMRIKTTDVISGQANGTVYDQFTVSFVYQCASDSLSITSTPTDIQDRYYTFGAAAITFPTPAITHTVPGCATTFKIYTFSSVISQWRDYADTAIDIPLPFISAFSTATGIASVSYAGTGTDAILTGKTWKPTTILPMKIVATSTYSKVPGQKVEDTFRLIMSDGCALNKIALDGTTYPNSNGGIVVNDFTYTIGTAAIAVKPLISTVKTIASCSITSKLYVFNPAINDWVDQTSPTYNWISGFVTSSGQLTISQAAGVYQSSQTYKMKITFTDLLADDPIAIMVGDEFEVTVVHTCDTNPFALTDQVNISYTVPAGTTDANSPTITVAKTTVTNANANSYCWLSYRTEFWDTTTNVWVQMSATSANASPRSTFILASSYSDVTGSGGVSHFTTNEYKLFLPHSQLTNFVSAYSNLTPKFRTKVYDVAGRTLYDEYEIAFWYLCWNDYVTMNTLIDQTYQFGQGAMTLQTPGITHTYAACPITYKIFGYFPGFSVGDNWFDYSTCSCLNYVISGFDVLTGIAVVTNASGTKTTTGDLKPQTIMQLKIQATSTQSKQAPASDIFYLKLRQSPCVDNKLSFDSATWTYANQYGTSAVTDYSYLIGTTAVNILPKYSTVFDTTSCGLTATVYIFDLANNLWTDVTNSRPAWMSAFQPTTGANIAGFMTIYQADTGFLDEKTYNMKIKIQDLLQIDPNASAIETLFDVTVYHKCSRNSFTISNQSDVLYDISALGTTAAITVPKSTVTGATAGCTLEFTTEILDYPSNLWVTLTDANVASSYYFIKAAPPSDKTSNLIQVETVNFGQWSNTIHDLRLRVRDPLSVQAGGNVIDTFRVKITYICNRDEIQVTTQITDFTYVFNSPQQALTPTTVFSRLQAGCATTYKLEVWSPVSQIWVTFSSGTHGYFISNWDSLTGTVSLTNNGSDGTNSLKPQTKYNLRISLTSTWSLTTYKMAYDDFTVTLQEGCYNNIIKPDGSYTANKSAGITIPDQVYKISGAGGSPTVTLIPLYSTLISSNSCPITAYFYVWDELNNVWVDKSALTAQPFTAFVQVDSGATHTAGTLTILQTSPAFVFVPEKIWTVKIKLADLQSANPMGNAIEHTFQVDIYHACQKNTLAFDAEQTNQLFEIKANTVTSTPVVIANSAITKFEAETVCLLNRMLQIYNPTSQKWIQFTSATLGSTYPWITAWTDPTGSFPVYTSSTNGFTVTTADFNTYDHENIPPSVFQMRMVVQDGYSLTPTATIYDNFEITIKYQCDDDIVTLTSDITMFVFSTNPGTADTVPFNYAQSITPCEMIFKVEVYDGFLTGVSGLNQISTLTTSTWIDFTNSAPNVDLAWRQGFVQGALTVRTDNLSPAASYTYDPFKDYAVRITYTSKYSQKSEAERTKVESYIVRLTPSKVCIWDSLKKSSEITDWRYIVKVDSTAEIRQPVWTRTVSSCKIYQKLYFYDEPSKTWIDFQGNEASYPFASFANGLNTADTNVGRITVLATRASIATQYWKPFKIYKVKITLDDLDANGLQLLSYEFTLELRDVCADNTLTKNSELPEITTYVINTPVSTLTPDFTPAVAALQGCITASSLEFFNTVTNKYILDNTGRVTTGWPIEWVNSFSTTVGILGILTTNIPKYSIEKFYQMRITVWLTESIVPDKSVDYYFQVIIKHQCANNLLSLNSDIGYQIYYIDPDTDNSNATGGKVITPDLGTTQTVPWCPLTCILEKWDASRQIWTSVTTANSSWLRAFSTVGGCTGVIEVWTKDFATYHPQENYPNNKPWTDINLRVTLRDDYAHSPTNQVQDTFTLSIRRPCSDSTLAVTNELQPFLYYVNTGDSAQIKPTWTNVGLDLSACTPNRVNIWGSPFFYLHFFDPVKRIWVQYDSSTHPTYDFVIWDPTSGTLVINTANFVKFDLYVVTVRITTMNTVSMFQDEFELTIKDKCRDSAITSGVAVKAADSTSRTEANPFLWDMWQYAEVYFQPIVVSSTPTACPTTYFVTDVNFARTEITHDTIFIDQSTTPFKIRALFRETQTRFYYIRALVHNVRNDVLLLTSEDKYFVKVSNPCLYANQVIAKTITGFLDYWIKDPVATNVVTPFHDWTTDTYGNINRSPLNQFTTGDHLCGAKTYQLYKSYPDRYSAQLHDPNTQPWISLTFNSPNWELKVQTNDPVYYTNANFFFYLRVSLDDYVILNPVNDVRWEPIPINLHNCQISDFFFPTIADWNYNVYTPIIYIEMTRFTESSISNPHASSPSTCNYPVTYTVRWKDFFDTAIPLPNWIVWKPTEFRYEVQTDDPLNVDHTRQSYKLELTGAISKTDMNPPLIKTQVVNLIVKNNCVNDTITIVNPISDYTYYINENSERNVWNYGTTPKPKNMQWWPKWTQSVEGCPVRPVLYRIPTVGARFVTGVYERTPIHEFAFTPIPIYTLWSLTKAWIWPFTVQMSLSTSDYSYDQQSWSLQVVMESIQSRSPQREGQIHFELQLRDICWDLPYTNFDAINLPLTFTIWQEHQFSHNKLIMQGAWGDYCTGSSYTLEYVSGPKNPYDIADPLTIDINRYYSDKNQYNTAGFQASSPYFIGTIPDISWEGTHRIRIVAREGVAPPAGKQYRRLYSATFEITYLNPCRTSVVTARPIEKMTNTVGDPAIVTQFYQDFKDSVSTTYGDGYNKCGPREHYLTDKFGASKTAPDNIYRISEYLYFTKAITGTPDLYRFAVQTNNYASIGLHEFILHVALVNYSTTSTEAQVPFSVMISPCIVTGLVPPSNYKWDYVVGSRSANYIFNFIQIPCLYTPRYTALLSNGGTIPSFTQISAIDGYFRVYAVSDTDVGKYEIVVTSTLSNLEVFGGATTTIDPSLRIDKNNPPPSFVYKASFTINLEVAKAPESFSAPNNTSPYFLPPPRDIWFYQGDKFVNRLGPAYDNEANNVRIEYDFGRAERFVWWDKATNTMIVQQNSTTTEDVGSYPMTISLYDDVKTSVAYGTVTWIGNITYEFKLRVQTRSTITYEEPVPEVSTVAVFDKYESNVIDVRGFSPFMIQNSVDSTSLKVAKPESTTSVAMPQLPTIIKLPSSQSNEVILPRIQQNELGVITTTAKQQSSSSFVENQEKKADVASPPKPFVKSLGADGKLKIGFTQKMKIPKDLKALNDQKVALRWTQSNDKTVETYMTQDGYRDFDIRPAVDLKLSPSTDSATGASGFQYEIVGFTESEMVIQINFDNPDAISNSGISTDQMSITFWSSELLQAENGLPLGEGQTISKSIIPQIDPKSADQLASTGRSIGWLIFGLIWGSILFAPIAGYDKNPFWMFFSFWQLYLHTPLMNLKVPGYVAAFWRQELMVFTLRNEKVHNWMMQLSKTAPEEELNYNLLFEVVGFNSLHVLVNLGLILWILAIIVCLIMVGWLIDMFCSVPDTDNRIQGLRKPVSSKPLHMLAVNLLVRFGLVSVVDFAICIFIALSAVNYSAFDDMARTLNLSVSLGLAGLFGVLLLFIVIYGIWRCVKASRAKIWKDFEVSEYVSTLYDGMTIQHPERTTIFLVTYMLRHIQFAAAVVFLYERPIFQLYSLLLTSILYNVVVAWTRPYNESYNMVLHYLNEFTYFFFLAMCLCFTDFMTDMTMRQDVANLLNMFMFFIMATNVFICLVSIVFTHKKFWIELISKDRTQEETILRKSPRKALNDSERRPIAVEPMDDEPVLNRRRRRNRPQLVEDRDSIRPVPGNLKLAVNLLSLNQNAREWAPASILTSYPSPSNLQIVREEEVKEEESEDEYYKAKVDPYSLHELPDPQQKVDYKSKQAIAALEQADEDEIEREIRAIINAEEEQARLQSEELENYMLPRHETEMNRLSPQIGAHLRLQPMQESQSMLELSDGDYNYENHARQSPIDERHVLDSEREIAREIEQFEKGILDSDRDQFNQLANNDSQRAFFVDSNQIHAADFGDLMDPVVEDEPQVKQALSDVYNHEQEEEKAQQDFLDDNENQEIRPEDFDNMVNELFMDQQEDHQSEQQQERMTEENNEALEMGWQMQAEEGPDEEEMAYNQVAYDINDILDEATDRREKKIYGNKDIADESKWRSRKHFEEDDDIDFL